MPVPPLLGVVAAASGVAVTTWNPADRSAPLVLTNGNLTCTLPTTTSYAGVRSTTSKGSGKWHFELLVNASPSSIRPAIGVANAVPSVSSPIGFSANSLGYYANGEVYYNGGLVTTLSPYTAGNTIAVELDADGDLIYFQRFGGSRSAGISVAGISGSMFAIQTQEFAGEQTTVNFGASAFLITPTGGFIAWG